MNSLIKSLTIVFLILLICITCSSSINANISKTYADIDSIEQSRGINEMDENVITHMFCFIKSCHVDHHCPYEFWHGTFFGFQTKLGILGIGTIGVGSLYMHLTNFPSKPEEPKLIVFKRLRTKVYTEDINVSVKGFIGAFQPTGGLSDGLFFGFAVFCTVKPL
jgi:hypothetical protein